MNKIVYQDSNEELMKAVDRNGEAMTTLIDTSTGIKSAASDLISKKVLEEFRPESDKVACIHLIAMGDHEMFGFNRNGDSFPQAALEKSAGTFVKYGHVFREHRNKDPKKAIGSVKYAAYDPGPGGMHRVELVIHMDKDKAEEEYEMAKKGAALNWSMSCKVPCDRCSVCGNEAKNIMHYCDHLKNHMGQYDSDFKKYAFAYNDNPTFFDISRVKNPADRIARHLGYYFKDEADDIQKAASAMCKAASADGDGILVPSAVAAMAEGITDTFDLDEQNMIEKLSSSEGYNLNVANAACALKEARASAMYGSHPFSMMETLTQDELDKMRGVKPETLFHELAKRASVLSFPAFCQYVSGSLDAPKSDLFKRAAVCFMPNVFTRIRAKVFRMVPSTDMFRGCSDYMAEKDPGRSDLVQHVMDGAEDKFSIRMKPTEKRVIRIIIKTSSVGSAGMDKFASYSDGANDSKAEGLAETYAQYQLRALCDIKDMHGEEVVNDYTADMVAGANSVMFYDRA